MPIPTPHLAPLPFTLSEGKEIIVEGQLSQNANRITISLCKENDLNHDTALTFDIRFNENVVVRNHFQGNWGSEDRQGGMPFKKGENCEVRFVAKHDEFQIFVNKQHFCDFKHRLGKESARNLLIQGDITINKISFPGSDSSQHGHGGSAIHDPPVPLNIPIGALQPGRKIVIAGVPTGNTRFSVNLVCGGGPNDDIALHFDVRFNYGKSTKKVILNHRHGGKWGGEGTEHHSFCFAEHQSFDLVIKVKDDGYKIAVNGEKLDKVAHHIQPDKVNHLNIVGEVKLHHVKT